MDDDAKWRAVFTRKLEVHVVEAFRLFRHSGLEPILIKGWAAGRNYPPLSPRYYTDIDLAFSSEEYEIAYTLVLTQPEFRFGVDLHRELRQLDTKPWPELFADSVEVDLDGTSIRVPMHEDHLRIMAVHWLTDGGAYKEKLWDIYYAIQNRPPGFDWDRCLGVVSDNRRGWVIAAIGLAHKYLKLEIDELPFAEEAKNLPAWLVSAVETEWKSDVRLRSLVVHRRDARQLLKQIRKRFPPNPIQATIDTEGRFDNGPRLGYQIRSMMKRTAPFLERVNSRLRLRN